jgi:alkylation response protein AidB-like acyl-CoA dehydrogenase
MRRFIDDEVIPAEPEFFAQQERTGFAGAPVLEPLRAAAKAQGLWALGHPKEIGGGGLSFMDFVYLNEIIGRSELGQLAVGSVSMQDSIMLHRYGSEEHKQRWLRPMVAGEIFPSVGLTEPEVAGSDPTLMRATARFDGEDIIVNAHKWFTTGANSAAFTTGVRRDRPGRGLPAPPVLVDHRPDRQSRLRDRAGDPDHGSHRRRPLRDPTHRRTGALDQPARGPRRGFVIAQHRLGPGRIFHCMRWLGQAQRAFELMCARATTRFAHGSLLSEKGEIQRYVAESAAEIQSHRLMTLDAARRMDTGTTPGSRSR